MNTFLPKKKRLVQYGILKNNLTPRVRFGPENENDQNSPYTKESMDLLGLPVLLVNSDAFEPVHEETTRPLLVQLPVLSATCDPISENKGTCPKDADLLRAEEQRKEVEEHFRKVAEKHAGAAAKSPRQSYAKPCGADLIGKGQGGERGGKYYCLRPGCFYPPREASA